MRMALLLMAWTAALGDDAPQDGLTLLPQVGHVSAVCRLGLSPDGSRLVSCARVSPTIVWDLDTGSQAVTIGEPGGMYGAAISSDAALVAAARDDGTVRIWRTRTGELMATLAAPDHGPRGCAFSPDGQRLATVGMDGAVCIWDWPAGTREWMVAGEHPPSTWEIAYSPDGSLLATGDRTGKIVLWDTGAGEVNSRIQAGDGMVSGLAFSPDGSLLASVWQESGAALWDPRTGELIEKLAPPRDGRARSPSALTVASWSPQKPKAGPLYGM